MAERIVITGIGPVSAVGIGNEEFATALREGRGAIEEATAFDVEPCRNKQAAEIVHFNVNDYLESEKNYLDRNSELAFAAAKLALDDAGFRPTEETAPRFGICLGTAYGNLDTTHAFYDSLVAKGPKFVSPFLFQHTYSNASASLLAIEYSIRGVHANFCSGSAAGAEAILYAFDSLRLGRADAILAGGVDALSEVVFKGMDSTGDERIPGEGAALLLLEREESAAARGAKVQGVVLGGAAAGTVEDAAHLACADAGITEKEIGAIHGPDHAIDKMLGHTLGASGALAAVAALLTMRPNERALVHSTDPSGLCIALVLGKE